MPTHTIIYTINEMTLSFRQEILGGVGAKKVFCDLERMPYLTNADYVVKSTDSHFKFMELI